MSGIQTLTIPSTVGKVDHVVSMNELQLMSKICSRIYRHKTRKQQIEDKHFGRLSQETFENEGMISGIYANQDHIILAFRGFARRATDNNGEETGGYLIGDFIRSAKLVTIDKAVDAPLGGKISNIALSTLDSKPNGLENGYEDMSFYEVMATRLNQLRHQYPHAKISITGHSLGGMIASAFAAKYLSVFPDQTIDGLYTFAQPRTGNIDFVRTLEEKLNGPYVRCAIDRDVFAAAIRTRKEKDGPSPLAWDTTENTNGSGRVHGGTALLIYEDEGRFKGSPQKDEGYAEKKHRPHVKLWIPNLAELNTEDRFTTLRRHAIKTHKAVTKYIKKSLDESHISVIRGEAPPLPTIISQEAQHEQLYAQAQEIARFI